MSNTTDIDRLFQNGKANCLKGLLEDNNCVDGVDVTAFVRRLSPQDRLSLGRVICAAFAEGWRSNLPLRECADDLLVYARAEAAWARFQEARNGFNKDACLAELVSLGFVPTDEHEPLKGCRPWTHGLREAAMKKIAGGGQ